MPKQNFLKPERLITFTDGVMAIAITLLVLDIRIPEDLLGSQLGPALLGELPHLSAYALSFLIVGVYWLAHHRLFAGITRVDGPLLRRNLAFLFFIALLPFPTTLIAEYGPSQLAVSTYALTVALTGISAALLLQHSVAAKLQDPPLTSAQYRYYLRRSLAAPTVMLLSILVAAFNPEIAMYSWILIGFIQPRGQGLGE